MATVYLDTGTASGTFTSGHGFNFEISASQTIDVTITGRDQEGSDDSWFTPNPATITAGNTTVTVTAQQITPTGQFFTYVVGGRNTSGNAHVVVGSSMHAHEKKAS
jgi:hypothetical protein